MSSRGYKGGGRGRGGRGAFRQTSHFACSTCGYKASSDGDLKWHKQELCSNLSVPVRGRGDGRRGRGQGGSFDGGFSTRRQTPPGYGTGGYQATSGMQKMDTFPCTFTGCSYVARNQHALKKHSVYLHTPHVASGGVGGSATGNSCSVPGCGMTATHYLFHVK